MGKLPSIVVKKTARGAILALLPMFMMLIPPSKFLKEAFYCAAVQMENSKKPLNLVWNIRLKDAPRLAWQ